MALRNTSSYSYVPRTKSHYDDLYLRAPEIVIKLSIRRFIEETLHECRNIFKLDVTHYLGRFATHMVCDPAKLRPANSSSTIAGIPKSWAALLNLNVELDTPQKTDRRDIDITLNGDSFLNLWDTDACRAVKYLADVPDFSQLAVMRKTWTPNFAHYLFTVLVPKCKSLILYGDTKVVIPWGMDLELPRLETIKIVMHASTKPSSVDLISRLCEMAPNVRKIELFDTASPRDPDDIWRAIPRSRWDWGPDTAQTRIEIWINDEYMLPSREFRLSGQETHTHNFQRESGQGKTSAISHVSDALHDPNTVSHKTDLNVHQTSRPTLQVSSTFQLRHGEDIPRNYERREIYRFSIAEARFSSVSQSERKSRFVSHTTKSIENFSVHHTRPNTQVLTGHIELPNDGNPYVLPTMMHDDVVHYYRINHADENKMPVDFYSSNVGWEVALKSSVSVASVQVNYLLETTYDFGMSRYQLGWTDHLPKDPSRGGLFGIKIGHGKPPQHFLFEASPFPIFDRLAAPQSRKDRITHILDFCRSFTEQPLTPIPDEVQRYYARIQPRFDAQGWEIVFPLLELCRSQSGVCRHRVDVFLFLADLCDIQAQGIGNGLHASKHVIDIGSHAVWGVGRHILYPAQRCKPPSHSLPTTWQIQQNRCSSPHQVP